ncbi:pyridine nucleotide-disulfide oxidoreductase (macronuclear) [Tetrahymena thermophila SB210]|uniref:Pyridine nucleotide-disulfide oxidoreductase n=1 Tax=Tetrahymena thermophila (strain SB210) TaxID=312017 RepID=Q241B3_TETTS|nr:pyridine nucleotide-disulfide oxidoreductase [Tetrahymena thermophila SB210]EAS02251.1 pyridine nucleotide-disulfide oxidoreductase [Tetrahymena thermophila SB210]|eukprot:XP_001022496.1 pyridine nucleotide-disulfide oxidoreductase [Tetrahymena thermophila SB210]
MFARGITKATQLTLRNTKQFSTMAGFSGLKSYSQFFTKSNMNLKIGLLGLIGVGIAGYSTSQSYHSDEYYEKVIPANLQEGQKIDVQVGPKEEDSVLVAKVDGKYYCVSNKCPHFGFSLSKGVMFYDKVVCPLHNAAFSVKDGAAEGGPVVNGLENFEIVEKDGNLHIKVPKAKLNVPKPFDMVKRDPNDKRKFVIVGGGPAGISAAETLRQSGYTGQITILSKEKFIPYDRTILSKALFFADINKLQYRSKEFLESYGIEVVNEVEVTEIDTERHFVQTKNQDHIHFDKLLLATGGSPNRIPVEGVNSKNVFTLREFSDLESLKNNFQSSKKVVVIGASFIGLETAASVKDFLKDKVDITVVDQSKVPYQRVLGSEVGAAIKKLHADNGIKFNLGVGIKSIESQNGVAKRVVLSDGTSLEADMVLIGAGVSPNTRFVGEKLEKDNYGALKTDVFLQTSHPDVFAAGDIANYPYHYTGQRARFEHINSSIYQGSIAALNMVGQKTPCGEIPFFWTRFWNKSLHYTGYAPNYDEVHIQGSLDKLEFVAWYIKNDRVVAVSAMNKGPVAMVVNEAMKQNVMPSGTEIKNNIVKYEDIQKRIADRGRNCKCSRGANCCSARKLQQNQASQSAKI